MTKILLVLLSLLLLSCEQIVYVEVPVEKTPVYVDISFDTAGGEYMKPVKAAVGQMFTSEIPIKQGFDFVSWTYNKGNDRVVIRTPFMVKEEIKLFATWEIPEVDTSMFPTYETKRGYSEWDISDFEDYSWRISQPVPEGTPPPVEGANATGVTWVPIYIGHVLIGTGYYIFTIKDSILSYYAIIRQPTVEGIQRGWIKYDEIRFADIECHVEFNGNSIHLWLTTNAVAKLEYIKLTNFNGLSFDIEDTNKGRREGSA